MSGAPWEDPIQLCRRLVQTPSVNPELEAGGGGEARIARLIEGWLKGWGCAVQRTSVASGRHNVLTRVDGKSCGPALLLAGHMDTVGAQGMSNPFSGEIRGGRLSGRGGRGVVEEPLAEARVVSDSLDLANSAKKSREFDA